MKNKVLLIDDSVTIHRVIDLSIDLEKYEIIKVFSKEDAAMKIAENSFDYILLDNKLDNMITGDYVSELRQTQPEARIILLVGAFDRFEDSDLQKSGADDYLVKPFDSQSLNAKLQAASSERGTSPEVDDVMSPGFVERIPEADAAREKDMENREAPAPVTSGAGAPAENTQAEALNNEEYLASLEEVQPEDLTEKGYAEDIPEETRQASELTGPETFFEAGNTDETIFSPEKGTDEHTEPETSEDIQEPEKEAEAGFISEEETSAAPDDITEEERSEGETSREQKTGEETFAFSENENAGESPLEEENVDMAAPLLENNDKFIDEEERKELEKERSILAEDSALSGEAPQAFLKTAEILSEEKECAEEEVVSEAISQNLTGEMSDGELEKVFENPDSLPCEDKKSHSPAFDEGAEAPEKTLTKTGQSSFSGITLSLSREEIMAMLGKAVDKRFLEEAIKEVLAANIREAVRSIVPAMAEKYIKEEIERLKEDE